MGDEPVVNPVRGRGRGRGGRRANARGGRGGRRGGQRGPQQAGPPNEGADESENEPEDEMVHIGEVGQMGENINAFPEAPDEPEEGEDPVPGEEQVPVHQAEFTLLDMDALNNAQFRIPGREFRPGVVENELLIERFEDMSPVEIVLYFGQGLFDLILECTNEIRGANLTMKDIYCYHAMLILMTIVRLDRVYHYWHPPMETMEFTNEANELKSYLPRAKFYRMRQLLRMYKLMDTVPGKTNGWKVERGASEINRVFRTTMSNPGQNISID